MRIWPEQPLRDQNSRHARSSAGKCRTTAGMRRLQPETHRPGPEIALVRHGMAQETSTGLRERRPAEMLTNRLEHHDDLQRQYGQLPDPLSHSVIHGNAWQGNLVVPPLRHAHRARPRQSIDRPTGVGSHPARRGLRSLQPTHKDRDMDCVTKPIFRHVIPSRADYFSSRASVCCDSLTALAVCEIAIWSSRGM